MIQNRTERFRRSPTRGASSCCGSKTNNAVYIPKQYNNTQKNRNGQINCGLNMINRFKRSESLHFSYKKKTGNSFLSIKTELIILKRFQLCAITNLQVSSPSMWAPKPVAAEYQKWTRCFNQQHRVNVTHTPRESRQQESTATTATTSTDSVCSMNNYVSFYFGSVVR